MSDGIDPRDMRILLVSGRPLVLQVLRQVLGIIGARGLECFSRGDPAIEMLCAERFDVVFCDDSVVCQDNALFIHAARRTPGLVNPMATIFLVAEQIRRSDVESARDRGFTDMLEWPVSAATVLKKLHTVKARPRPFIAAPGYFGPDRRSVDRGVAVDRRKHEPKKVVIPTS